MSNFAYTKKPVTIEAYQITGHLSEAQLTSPTWLAEAIQNRTVRVHMNGMLVHTLEGDMFGLIGDWIIRGVEGEIYPCKDSIFKATYVKAATTFKERAVAELAELEERVAKLIAFRKDHAKFKALSPTDQQLLEEQGVAMCKYLDVLKERVGLME